MIHTYYVPIYKWGNTESEVTGSESGTTLYTQINELYAFEPNAIGYFEVSGKFPTKIEFKYSDDIL